MRRVLLATTALAMAASVAMAADSNTVQVTATVSATCSMTDPDNVSFGLDPVPGVATDQSDFSFTCNFAGANDGEGAAPGGSLSVKIVSANGGLNNLADQTSGNPNDRSYTINYNGTGALAVGSPTFTAPGIPFSESSSGPGAANARNFVVKLVDALPVAGSYSDVLTVSVAP